MNPFGSRGIEFAVPDTGSGAHPLEFPRLDDRAVVESRRGDERSVRRDRDARQVSRCGHFVHVARRGKHARDDDRDKRPGEPRVRERATCSVVLGTDHGAPLWGLRERLALERVFAERRNMQ